MIDVFTQMAALIACGIAWRVTKPFGLDADTCRHTLTTVVYALLLPALVLDVLWQSPLGWDSGRLAMVAASGVLAATVLAWLAYRIGGTAPPIAGALILAAAFPNATYMGLPVLEQLLGPWARSVAIQYDLFACTPLLLTLGILIAQRYGQQGPQEPMVRGLLRVPPLWAAVAAVALNVAGVPQPQWLDGLLGMLGGPVVPLMLISLGMGLQWSAWRPHYAGLLLPVLIIQLILAPLAVLGLGRGLGLEGGVLQGAVLEAAMPSMVLGIVLCDRYGLNVGIYAIAVTLSTALSLITIPLWFNWISGYG